MLYLLFWTLAAILAQLPTLVSRSHSQRYLARRVNTFCFIPSDRVNGYLEFG
jgi:hypothetical protein